MKTRIFWTLYTLQDKSDHYRKEKKETDFPDDVNIEAAHAEIWDKFGKLGRDDRRDAKGNPLAPMQYAVIHGHTSVNPDREAIRLPEERVYEAPLFPPQFYKETLSRKPNER